VGGLLLLLAFSGGLALGVLSRGGVLALPGRTAAESRRLRKLAARVGRDGEGRDVEARTQLARAHLEREDPRRAAAVLGPALVHDPEHEELGDLARRCLRGLLLHDLRDDGGRARGLLPQDLNWHPGTKRLVMRMKELTLGGLVELKHLDLHIDDFEPLKRKQPLPRVVVARALVREERLAFVLESRIDWRQTPLRDLQVHFRDGRVEVTGTVRLKMVPIGFRVTASAEVLGTERIRLAFPHPPRVAGVVPLPIDTVLKIVARKVDEKLPGALVSNEEATLDLDLLRAGIPPVEVNLREVRIEDGRVEVLCLAEGVDPEDVDVLRLPPPHELLPDPEPPGDDPEDEGSEPAAPSGPQPGLFESVVGLFSGSSPGALERAVDASREARQAGDLSGALDKLEDLAEAADPGSEAGAALLEELAAVRLDIGGEKNRGLAIQHLEAVLERQPGRARASLLLGRVHLDRGELEQAEARTRIACTLGPFEPDPYAQLQVALEMRGAMRPGERARSIRRILATSLAPAGEAPAPPELGRSLFQEDFEALLHPDGSTPTGRLLELLLGGLGWLGEAPAEEGLRPLKAGEFPRLGRLVESISSTFQIPELALLLRPGGDAGDLGVSAGERAWAVVGERQLEGWTEPAMSFHLGRAAFLARTGLGPFVKLGESSLDLLFALLRAVGREAHRDEHREHGAAAKAVEDLVEKVADSVSFGWVVRPEDLDPYLARDARWAARTEALAYHDAGPSFLQLQRWQWAVEASADRAGLLVAGSVEGALEGLRQVSSERWELVEERGLEALERYVDEDRLAYRVRELLRVAVDPHLEELERKLLS
jgi:hypothetical protein